ncbi:DUF1294 domain-containing protein [Saccharibacillus alkalitolerans]|uniref:DUF1294 domain-containing protein n=1 Tax=Saccharibacillus alkalitolerans TaxID=2705290 RepID=A0ABX0F632_9BACL|nr:DUF1294 domain-containing protein [Saccharibacillus alkalitolerans]NGZ75390.1 DUF1294 domain-containing protein [Saccharibacillus alkalitolerans]
MTLTIPAIDLVLAGWLIVLNAIAYAIMASDKRRARKGRHRVPERTLFIWAAAGGALGIWAAMRTKRHKTQHASFKFGVPALLLLNIAVYGALFYLFNR